MVTFKLRKLILVAFVFQSAQFIAPQTNAQIFEQSSISSKQNEPHDPFLISNSVAIGLTGIKSYTTFDLIDEFGVQFDTCSLLANEANRDLVGVSKEQYAEFRSIRMAAEDEMKSTVVTASYSQEHRDKLKSIFMSMEEEIRSELTDSQIEELRKVRMRIGIEAAGLKYVGQSDVAELLGLSESDVSQFESLGDEALDFLRKEKSKLLVKANRKLIESLPTRQNTILEQTFSKKTMGDFSKQELFVKSRTKSKPNKRKSQLDLYQKVFASLKLQSVRNLIELNEDKVQSIKSLSKTIDKTNLEEIKSAIHNLVSDQQLTVLFDRTSRYELNSRGTVESICDGLISQVLELSEEDSEKVFESGLQIQADLEELLEQRTRKYLTDTLKVAPQHAETVAALLIDSQ